MNQLADDEPEKTHVRHIAQPHKGTQNDDGYDDHHRLAKKFLAPSSVHEDIYGVRLMQNCNWPLPNMTNYVAQPVRELVQKCLET